MAQVTRLLSQIWILALEELRDLIFRKRAFLSLLLYLGVVLLIVLALAYLEKVMSPAFSMMASEQDFRAKFLADLARYGLDDEYLLFERLFNWPIAVVSMHLVSFLWYPTLVALVSCDMVSLDLYRGTLRYLLGRTNRTAYFISKLVAHLLLYLVVHAFSVAMLFVVCSLRVPNFNPDTFIQAILAYQLVMAPFILFVVATTQFISCWSSRPMNAIIRLHLLWVLFLILLFISPLLSPLNKGMTLGLVAPLDGHQVTTLWGFVAWSAVFIVAGWGIIQRRAV